MTDHDKAIIAAAEKHADYIASQFNGLPLDMAAETSRALYRAVMDKRKAAKPRLTPVDDLVTGLDAACRNRMTGARREIKGHDVAFALRMRDEEWRDVLRKLPTHDCGKQFDRDMRYGIMLADALSLSDAK